MMSLLKIKDPGLFQGEKYLYNKKDYFEGWYFKNTCGDIGISFIPGISINNGNRICFIQVITNNNSYYIEYRFDLFEYNDNPFYIKIGNNYFSKNKIHIDIKDMKQDLVITGEIKYFNSINIDTNIFNPNIMGPFTYIPFMECNHAILSMKCNAYGNVKINNEVIIFDNGISYIEKDYGCSFPNKYVWIQGNNFSNKKVSFMCSIANIPFLSFNFKGLICSLMINNYEYRFATYNNSKIIKYDISDEKIEIILKKKDYFLYIKSRYENGFRLIAPTNGKMNKNIIESINARVMIKLCKGENIIFSDVSNNCGMEVVI